jgi:Protein of unknown function (DUF2842)
MLMAELIKNCHHPRKRVIHGQMNPDYNKRHFTDARFRGHDMQMNIRTRKLIGTIGLILLAVCWTLIAMALAQSVLTNINSWIAVAFYVVAGLGWVLPAMPLVKWMSRP